ncbi:Rho GTPase-activating protein 27 [Sparganum proliferum]
MRLFLSLFPGCPQSDSPGPVFGGRLTQQAEAPDHSGVPRLLVEMVKALRRRGLCMEGIYRVPGRASRLQEIIQLANSNASELCERLVWDEEEAFDGRAISSAIKRYLGALPVSLLNANMFASFVASTVMGTASERGGRSRRTPAGLANAVCQLRVALMKAFGCPGKATALDLERGWRLATLDFVMRHFREVVALQAINRMSPRALALCLAPSLFGSTDDAEINSQVLELLIEHWPWLSECLLHRGSQPVSADRLGEPLSDACLYACRYQRHCFLQSLCLPPTLPPSSSPPPPPPPPSVDGSTTIFAAYEDIQERQLIVLFLVHCELNIREDGVELFLECQHLIPFDDDEGIIHIPGPELRFVVLEDQRLLPLQDRLGELIGVPFTCS